MPEQAATTSSGDLPAHVPEGRAPLDLRLDRPLPNYSGAETDVRLVELWLSAKAPSTRRKYLEDLAKCFDCTGSEPPAQTTLADLQKFAELISVLMAPSMQVRTLACVKSLFSLANKVGYLSFNVSAALELPKVKNTLAERTSPRLRWVSPGKTDTLEWGR